MPTFDVLGELSPLSDAPVTTRKGAMAALMAGAFLGTAAIAKGQSTSTNPAEGALRLRLLRRTSYGPLPDEVALSKQMGYDAYLNYQLNYESIDDTAAEQAAAFYSTINFSVRDLFKVREDVAKDDLAEATIVRALLSKRQLYQRMVEFWTDHFNVFFDKVGVLKVVHDRDVIRKYALGNFPQMLMANTLSPATLVYLDNQESSKASPNQNLAREMMELHSVGVNGGYTQNDVINVARCLTGCTVRQWPEYALDIGQFVFDKTNHYNGVKSFMGKTIAAGGGIKDIQTVVNTLAAKRSTGRFLGTKLCRFFLGYEPGEALVESLADIYQNTGGEIKPMVQAVLAQGNLAAAPLMVKRPFHYTIGLLRQSQAQMTYIWPIREVLYSMGQHPFEWAPPNGYPVAQPYWAGGLLARWNFSFQLFYKEIDYLKVAPTSIIKTATTRDDVLDRIIRALYLGEMNAKTKAAVYDALESDDRATARATKALAYAAAMPGYQQC